jgi:hypothetical protein
MFLVGVGLAISWFWIIYMMFWTHSEHKEWQKFPYQDSSITVNNTQNQAANNEAYPNQ